MAASTRGNLCPVLAAPVGASPADCPDTRLGSASCAKSDSSLKVNMKSISKQRPQPSFRPSMPVTQKNEDTKPRLRAQTSLRGEVEHLRRLATVVSNSNDAVIMHDLEGKILAWNRGAQETYGYAENEALGKNVREIVAEPDREAALSLIQSIKEGNVVKSFELRRLAKDGRVLDVWLTTTLLRDESGRPVAIATTERDITERKQAETALKENVEHLRRLATVVSNSNDAVIMHDLDGKILAWNRGAQETYGYAESEALGTNVREIVAEPDREAALSLIQSIQQGKLVKSFELRRLAKDGRVLDVWLTTTLLRDESGQPMAIATTERDITERKRAEQEIRALNTGLEQHVVERTAQLQAANKELEAFAYSVSHDLRAPLRAIDGFSRILMDDYAAALPAEASRYLGLVRSNTQTMGELVDDLLAFSRLSQQPMRKQTVRTADVAHAALDALRAEQDGREIEVLIGDLPACEGDAAMLKQVYLNLLGNALKFTRKRPRARIEVGWEEQAGVPVYFVRDNGVGFDMRYVDKLFGVFQRLHRTEEYEGTGVGLAIVQRIVKRHGGRAWAEVGAGPRRDIPFHALRRTVMIPNGVEILLVEDNPNDVELTLHAFKKHNLTNKIHVARDGAEALEFLFGTDEFAEQELTHLPKLILLDLKMPKVDGLAVLKQIKSDKRTKAIPVVVLTSSREESDLVASYELGVNSYIRKPVDFDKFTESVRTIGLYWLLLNEPLPR